MESTEISHLSKSFSVLNDAVATFTSEERQDLQGVMQTDRNCRIYLEALVGYFINTRRPAHEFEQQVWQSVHIYLQQLELAYAFALQETEVLRPSKPVQQALLNRLECLALFAEWQHLRYQALTEFFWRELHMAFQMAEPVPAIASAATVDYLRVLMLDSVNRSNMTRSKIALLASWLREWCEELSLSPDYDSDRHVFFVDLQVPRGARRIRKLSVGSDCRYWHVDSIIARLERMHQQLASNELPPDFSGKTTLPNAKRLVAKLLSEWSRTGYHRERRSEGRQSVMKYAQVVHGMLNVCQHVKNRAFASALLQPDAAMAVEEMPESRWVIENESKFGFGTFVYADFNRWLEPGYLIAMDYELNPDLTVVGVVRSIEQRSAHKYSVGIEVLSHMPSYVRLQQLTDIAGGTSLAPFPAMFLPENEERKESATIILPLPDYTAGGMYRLHVQQQEHVLQLAEVVEQQGDWVRVAINVATDITL
jgi:hypothetical protein